MHFEDVFAGVAGRSTEEHQQAVVDGLAVDIAEHCQVRVAQARFPAKERAGDGSGAGARHAHYADAGCTHHLSADDTRG